MGRKVNMKKIENATRCQVTFSKRRSSLIRKAQDISVSCDVDVAFVAFSPSGRLSKFSNNKRIEDVLQRFINLSTGERVTHMKNLKEKQERLNHLDYISGDENKLQHLKNQIENIERFIRTLNVESQLHEACVRDFEPYPRHESSLAQVIWCERNVKNTLRHVIDRKRTLLGKSSIPYTPPNLQTHIEMEKEPEQLLYSYNVEDHQLNGDAQKPHPNQLLMQLDPWISPYSSKVPESLLQDRLYKDKEYTSHDSRGHLISTDHLRNNISVHSSCLHSTWISKVPSEATNVRVLLNDPLVFQEFYGVENYSSIFHDKYSQKVFSDSENRDDIDSERDGILASLNFERDEKGDNFDDHTTNDNLQATSAELGLLINKQKPVANTFSTVDVLENDVQFTTRNAEDDSWDWGAILLPESLSFEDLDIPF